MHEREFAVCRAVGIKGVFLFAVLVLSVDLITDLELLFRVQDSAVPGLGMLTVILQALLEITDDDLSIWLFRCQVPNDRTHQNAHTATSFSRWAFNSPVKFSSVSGVRFTKRATFVRRLDSGNEK